MNCSTGWLLDVSVGQNRTTIWIKTIEGIILRLIDTYQPSFYVLPKDEYAGADLFQILSQQSIVKNLEWEDKFTDLFDLDRHGMKKLICVYTESKLYHNTLVKRHDAPNFIKEFQSELLQTLFDCNEVAEVSSKGYDNALLLVTRTIAKVMTGEIEVQDLVVSRLLRQDIDKYRSLFPHVSAAIRLREAGKSIVRGENIQFVYTDAQHKNPLCRVTPLGLIKQGNEQEQKYDKEKYRDMLLEAAETVLGYFGFDRTVYGDTSKKNRNRKWWNELQEERIRDIETEGI